MVWVAAWLGLRCALCGGQYGDWGRYGHCHGDIAFLLRALQPSAACERSRNWRLTAAKHDVYRPCCKRVLSLKELLGWGGCLTLAGALDSRPDRQEFLNCFGTCCSAMVADVGIGTFAAILPRLRMGLWQHFVQSRTTNMSVLRRSCHCSRSSRNGML